MVIKVLKLTPTAKSIDKSEEDMAYDICSDEDKIITNGEIYTIKTGIKICPPKGYHYSIRPRSGLAVKHGIHIMAGQIDGSYRGEILVCLTSLKKDTFYKISKGDKIAQIKFERDVTYPVVEVTTEEELGFTNRGENGFGSTGL